MNKKKLQEIYLNKYIIKYEDIANIIEEMDIKIDKLELEKFGIAQRFLLDKNSLSQDRKRYFTFDRSEIVIKTFLDVLPYVFDKPLKILDVGCGYGEYMCLLESLGHEVIGINPNFISEDFWYVNKKLKLNVIEHDITNPMPFPDKFFDAVFCIGVVTLKAFNDIKKIILELDRISNRYVSIRCHEKMLKYHHINSTKDLMPNERKLFYLTNQTVIWEKV